MKPQQFSGDHHQDSLMNRREPKKTIIIGEKIRRACETAMVAMAGNEAIKGQGGRSRNYISREIERRNQRLRSGIEDPIRTMIFLGSWSHT